MKRNLCVEANYDSIFDQQEIISNINHSTCPFHSIYPVASYTNASVNAQYNCRICLLSNSEMRILYFLIVFEIKADNNRDLFDTNEIVRAIHKMRCLCLEFTRILVLKMKAIVYFYLLFLIADIQD